MHVRVYGNMIGETNVLSKEWRPGPGLGEYFYVSRARDRNNNGVRDGFLDIPLPLDDNYSDGRMKA